MPFVAFPALAESAETLLELRRAERDERKRERLHALWLLASGEVGSRAALARRLGRNRETLSRWLADYAQGGLRALLRPAQRSGPPSQGGISLPATVQEAIRARLAQAQGERGYLALWRWARAEHSIAVGYSRFYRWVRYRLDATLKVARKSHGQKKRPNSRLTVKEAGVPIFRR
jgi:transposase